MGGSVKSPKAISEGAGGTLTARLKFYRFPLVKTGIILYNVMNVILRRERECLKI